MRRSAMSSKLNIPLILGIIIVFALILFSFYPEYFTPSDPYGKERLDFIYIDGELNVFEPPVAPCAEYPWGTDVYGRDMRSLLFYGSRLTLFTAVLIAVGRLLIALPLAILASYRSRPAIWLIKQFSIMFSAFPLIILTLLLSRIRLFAFIFNEPIRTIAYILIIFGWSRLANLLREKVTEILAEDFIEGEIAIGKNRLEIAVQNIMPHLIPSMVILFFLEIAQALLLLAQIGVFGLITSSGTVDGAGDFRIPFEIEWVSLLTSTQIFLSFRRYRLVLYPASAFAVSIIGFNLLGEGLRLEFNKRNSRIITWIRGIPGFLSPLRLMYEIKHWDIYKTSVRRKLAFYAAVLLLLFFPQTGSKYDFEPANAYHTIAELSKPEYGGRKSGSGTNEKIAQYLAGKLQEYGIQPYDGKYIHEFELKNAFNVKKSTLSVVDAASKTAELDFRKDYYIVAPENIEGTYELQYVTMKELGIFPYSARDLDITSLSSKVLLADIRGLDGLTASRYIGFINNMIKPKALIYILDRESEKVTRKETADRYVDHDMTILSLVVSSNKGDELIRMQNPKISLYVDCEFYANAKSSSVAGYIPGSDETLKDEIIIIGSSFDSVGDDEAIRYPSAMEAGGAAIELEIARALGSSKERPERTVIFAFWDSSQNEERGSAYFIDQYYRMGYRKAFYIDLKNFGFNKSKQVIADTTNTLPKDYLAQKYIKALKKHARRNDVKLSYGKVSSPTTQDTLKADINAIVLDSRGIDDAIRTAFDNLDNIDSRRLKGPGQMMLDTIYDIVCGGIR